MELWKDIDWIDGYQGVLQVSSIGNVRRHSYTYQVSNRWGRLHTTTKPDRIYALSDDSHGYSIIAIKVNRGKRKKLLVHRLVGRAFVPGFENGLTINHINGIKKDNRAENLEWVTLSVNTKKQWETGLVKPTPKKLTSGQVRIIRELIKIGVKATKISVLCSVDPKSIYLIADGRRWRDVD